VEGEETMPPRKQRKRWDDMKKQDIPLESALRAYLLHHEDRNHSAKTVRWYSDMLDRFLTFVGPDAKIGDIHTDTIRNYLREVRRRDFKQFTMHAYARTLKTFLLWLDKEGYTTEPLAKAIDMPKVPRYQDVTIEVLTDDEITHLLGMLDPATDIGPGSGRCSASCWRVACGSPKSPALGSMTYISKTCTSGSGARAERRTTYRSAPPPTRRLRATLRSSVCQPTPE